MENTKIFDGRFHSRTQKSQIEENRERNRKAKHDRVGPQDA